MNLQLTVLGYAKICSTQLHFENDFGMVIAMFLSYLK